MEKREKIFRLAGKLKEDLRPYCRRIKIAGSIRRKEKNLGDIDLVLIPRNKDKLEGFLKKKGKYLQGGEHESTFRINGIKVELYYTNSDEFGAALLAYSSRKGSEIGLRAIAKRKGFKLNNHGLFKKNKRIAGKTEREIYKSLGRPYKSPEKR